MDGKKNSRFKIVCIEQVRNNMHPGEASALKVHYEGLAMNDPRTFEARYRQVVKESMETLPEYRARYPGQFQVSPQGLWNAWRMHIFDVEDELVIMNRAWMQNKERIRKEAFELGAIGSAYDIPPDLRRHIAKYL